MKTRLNLKYRNEINLYHLSRLLDLVKIRGVSLVLPFSALFHKKTAPLQLLERPLYSGAGEAQVPSNGLDGGPALAVLVGSVLEVHVDQLGPGGHVLLIDVSE